MHATRGQHTNSTVASSRRPASPSTPPCESGDGGSQRARVFVTMVQTKTAASFGIHPARAPSSKVHVRSAGVAAASVHEATKAATPGFLPKLKLVVVAMASTSVVASADDTVAGFAWLVKLKAPVDLATPGFLPKLKGLDVVAGTGCSATPPPGFLPKLKGLDDAGDAGTCVTSFSLATSYMWARAIGAVCMEAGGDLVANGLRAGAFGALCMATGAIFRPRRADCPADSGCDTNDCWYACSCTCCTEGLCAIAACTAAVPPARMVGRSAAPLLTTPPAPPVCSVESVLAGISMLEAASKAVSLATAPEDIPTPPPRASVRATCRSISAAV